jgi:hypothetical protein
VTYTITGKRGFTMLKSYAVSLFGSATELARQCRISRQAIQRWPDELTHAQEDRVVAAVVRCQKEMAEAVIGYVEGIALTNTRKG